MHELFNHSLHGTRSDKLGQVVEAYPPSICLPLLFSPSSAWKTTADEKAVN